MNCMIVQGFEKYKTQLEPQEIKTWILGNGILEKSLARGCRPLLEAMNALGYPFVNVIDRPITLDKNVLKVHPGATYLYRKLRDIYQACGGDSKDRYNYYFVWLIVRKALDYPIEMDFSVRDRLLRLYTTLERMNEKEPLRETINRYISTFGGVEELLGEIVLASGIKRRERARSYVYPIRGIFMKDHQEKIKTLIRSLKKRTIDRQALLIAKSSLYCELERGIVKSFQLREDLTDEEGSILLEHLGLTLLVQEIMEGIYPESISCGLRDILNCPNTCSSCIIDSYTENAKEIARIFQRVEDPYLEPLWKSITYNQTSMVRFPCIGLNTMLNEILEKID